MNVDQERADFEAWAIEQKIAWRDEQHGLCFYDGNGKSYWLGYQAGRAAGIRDGRAAAYDSASRMEQMREDGL